jgi:hypothetical protein
MIDAIVLANCRRGDGREREDCGSRCTGDSAARAWRFGFARDRPARGRRVYLRRFDVIINIGVAAVDNHGIGFGFVGAVRIDVIDGGTGVDSGSVGDRTG